MTEFDLGKVVGDDGEAGNGIASITKTGTSGLVDTYTITFDDGSTTTFTVTNGSNASVTIQTSWGSTTSDSKVPSEKLTKDSLDNKVSKSSTTGLLKNDGSVMTSGTGSSNYSAGNHTHSGYITTSSTTGLIKNDGSIMTSGTGSGNYSAGNHTHSNYISTSSTSGLIKNDGTVDTSSYLTTGSASSTYQPKLVSGTNIKTVNNESLLGSGNITIQGGSSVDVVTSWEATLSDTKVPSEKLTKNSLDGKANSTHNHGYILNDGTVTNIITPSASYSFSGFLGVFEDLDDVGYKIIPSSFNTDYIKNTSALSNLGTNANSTQAYINGRINTLIATKLTGTKVTSWSSTVSDSNVPSEKLVKDTLDTKIAKSSTSGLVKNDGTIDTSAYITSSAITGMLTTSDVKDNLTSTDTDKPLSAKQGKVLNDLIGQAITYINQ